MKSYIVAGDDVQFFKHEGSRGDTKAHEQQKRGRGQIGRKFRVFLARFVCLCGSLFVLVLNLLIPLISRIDAESRTVI